MLLSELKSLRGILEKAWSKRTSYDPENYDEESESYGQCYVTARALYHVFGWGILHTRKEGANHYWNILPNGTEVDFTSDQMGGDGFFPVSSIRTTGRERVFKPLRDLKTCNVRLREFLRQVEPALKELPMPRVVRKETVQVKLLESEVC